MKPTRHRASLVLALGLALGAASCGKQIGDDCQAATDCDPNGARICDISQPGGYCTILGCDETTCPSGATCIRYFPVQFLTKTCSPYCEDWQGLTPPPDGGADGGLAVDAGPPPLCPDTYPPASGTEDTLGVCPDGPTNDCTADEICLDVGLCAPRANEVRYCAKACGSNGDCRDGYTCRPTGTEGSVALTQAAPCAETAFCAPLR